MPPVTLLSPSSEASKPRADDRPAAKRATQRQAEPAYEAAPYEDLRTSEVAIPFYLCFTRTTLTLTLTLTLNLTFTFTLGKTASLL